METYAMRKAEKTDKSTIEIPDGVTFPRELTQYRVGHMQVFESPAQDDSKPVLLYIHGGAYYQNFNMLHWKAMAEWAETTGCGIVAPNYPMLYQYTAKDAHPLMIQLQATAGALPRQTHYDYGRFCRRRFQSGLDTGAEGRLH
jgi:acetyl esterase/lipase